MLKTTLLLLSALTALAADNTWDKVKDLKTGTELRIYKKGKPPLIATMGDCTDDRLIVVVKNEEVGIDKQDIDRIDYRPLKTNRVTTKTTTTDTTQTTGVGPSPQGSRPGPTSSTTTSYNVGSKPDFEMLYRRPPPPQKPPQDKQDK